MVRKDQIMSCIRRSGSCVIRYAILFISACIVSLVTVYLTEDFTVKDNIPNVNNNLRVLTSNQSLKNTEKCKRNCSAFMRNLKTNVSEIAKYLHRAKTHVRGTKTSDSLRDAIIVMDGVLKSLNINKHFLVDRNVLSPKSICPEKYMGALYGYPMFYTGFEETSCSFSKHLSDLITVVVFIKDSDVDVVSKRTNMLLKTLTDHRNVTILIATSPSLEPSPYFAETVHFINIDVTQSDGWIWNRLIVDVKTPYVLVARNAEMYTEDSRLERLVREIEMLQVPVAASAVRYPNGHWTKGCYQAVHKNFTLRYFEGYDESLHECLFCDYAVGPFVTLTETLKSIPFTESEMDAGLFEDWFLRLTKRGLETIVCPDTMFHVRYDKTNPNWKVFIDEWGLYKYISPQGQTVFSDCSNADSAPILVHSEASRVLSPCRLQTNSDIISFLMNFCETNDLFCAVQSGTALGAVKFEKTLPWERDADIGFLSSNYSALLKHVDYLKTHNFEIKDISGESLILGFLGWRIEMNGQHKMDSVLLLAAGIKPTRVFLDGKWLIAPTNPGLNLRNAYGHELYQHALHWRDIGAKTGWEPYTINEFPQCNTPEDQDCLDRYNSNGNLAFSDPLP